MTLTDQITGHTSGATSGGVALVDRMADLVLTEAAACQEARTLTAPVVDALWSTGLMTYMNPAVAGGAEPSLGDMIDTWQRMAFLDASFGWIGIANLPSAAVCAAYLPDAGFAATFGATERTTMGGQFAPNGQGVRVDGGYRLTGKWNFGSGTGHSPFVCAGFLPLVDGDLEVDDAGDIVLLTAVIPRDEITFTDGWFVQGLQGTGSFDYEVTDLFVPEERVFGLFSREPHRGDAPVFRMGLMSITAAGHAAWALGVAESMLADIRELAQTRVRMGDMTSLANKPTFQAGYARHLAMWKAARTLVYDTYTQAEALVAAGSEIDVQLRADLRLAACYATDACREVAQWAHLAAGTVAIREGSRLERAFRDLYTGTQHAFIGEKVAIEAAQVKLGLLDHHRGL